jgi:5'-3' exonuclease
MNVLLVDTCYFNFYRFFATSQWYKCAYSDEEWVHEPGYNWSENELFWDKFKKMFLDTLAKFEKKLKIDKVIFARDCKRKDIWRMPVFPTYKGDRDEKYKKTNFQGGAVFQRCYTEILAPLIDNKRYYQIKIPRMEADDIIALSIEHLDEMYPGSNITVISSDHDLLQLIRPNVVLMDAKMKSYNHKSLGTKYKDIYMKCIVGDKSDCIPKMLKGLGPKTAMKLIEDNELLLAKFTEHPECFDIFSKNYLLVSFDNMPQPFKDAFKAIVPF